MLRLCGDRVRYVLGQRFKKKLVLSHYDSDYRFSLRKDSV